MFMQVTFQFPTDSEIRYLEQRPRPGDRVRGRRGELFVVARVERDGAGYLASCVTPSDLASDLAGDGRRVSRRLRTVA
jgi:hypothetical protein